MIEADKMLHLRRYVLTVLRADAKSRVARTLHTKASSSHREGGYVLRYVPSPTRASYIATKLSRPHYVACICRPFGTTFAQSSVDDIDQKVMSLCEDAKHDRLSVSGLREVIELCDQNNYPLDANTGVQLLKCCGDVLSTVNTSERCDLADRVWQLVNKNGDTALSLDHYNTLLHVHVMNNNLVNPKEFLANMIVEPNEYTYRLLLDIAIKVGDSGHLRDVMSVIKKKNIILDEDALGTLIRTCFTSDNVDKIEQVMTFIKDANLPMDKLYTELACGYAILGDIPNLVKIVNDESQSDASLLRIIKSLSASNNGRHIPVVLNFISSSIAAIESDILKTIAELVRMGHTTDAHTIVNCLALNKATADQMKNYVDTFLEELIIVNAPVEDVTKYACNYVDSGCDPLALIDVAAIGLKLGRENLCLATFDTMLQKGIQVRPHYYWPLLITANKKEGETKVFSLVKTMVDTGVEIDYDTLITHIYPYVNTVNPVITLQRLQVIGIPAVILYTPMISFLLFQNRMQDIITLYQHSYMKLHYRSLLKPLTYAYFSTRDIESCTRLLSIFSAGHEFVVLYLLMLLNNKRHRFYIEDLQSFLEVFKKDNVRIAQNDAEILKKKLAKINFNVHDNIYLSEMIDSLVDQSLRHSSVKLVPLSKHMTNKELACLLVELENKKLSTKGCLCSMLEIYCAENNLKQVEKIKQEIDENKIEISIGLKMHLFSLYVKYNKLKEAEVLFSEIHNSADSFMIDNDKIVMFANALMNADRPKSAFDVIKKTINVNNKRNAERQCFELLSTLARSKYHDYTKDMLSLLVQKDYCAVTTEILRPLVTIPLERNDIPSALNMFMECARIYNKTPLAQELLTRLLREKNNPRLRDAGRDVEQVYNTVAKINGMDVANALLAIALATLDKTKELRTILEKQRISAASLVHYSYYAQRHNVTDILSKILDAMPDKTNVQQDVLYDALLFSYSKESNCNAALALWKKMREKDIKPSEQFKENLIQCLLMNKMLLPTELTPDNDKMENSND